MRAIPRSGGGGASSFSELTADTLANLNAAISDADVDDDGDARPLYTGGSVAASKAAAQADLEISVIDLPNIIGSRWAGDAIFAGLGSRATHQMADVADLVTSAGDSAWANAGADASSAPLASAAISNGEIRVRHDASTADQWFTASGFTAPFNYWSPGAVGGALVVQWHMRSLDADEFTNRSDLFVGLYKSGDRAVNVGGALQCYTSGSNRQFRIFNDASSIVTDTSKSVAEIETGWWVRLVAMPDGSVFSLYSQTSKDAEPTSWTLAALTSGVFTPNDIRSLEFGYAVSSGGTGASQLQYAISNVSVTTPAEVPLP